MYPDRVMRGLITLGVVLGLCGQSGGQTAPPDALPDAPPPPPLSVDASVTFLNQYFFRGWLQEDQGFIAQPAFKGSLAVYRGEGPLRQVSLVAGIRSSLHSERTGAKEPGPDIWYEADIVAGVSWDILDRWNVETAYVAITSPNGAWDTIEEVDTTVRFNDAGLWGGDFALQPFAKLACEFDGSAGIGREGVLLQLGIEPGFGLIHNPRFPVRLSFPIEAGLSLDDYYVLPMGGDDDTLGYLSTGVSLTMPLVFMPKDYGRWGVIIGADLMYLGDNMETFNHGDDLEVIGRLTIGAKF